MWRMRSRCWSASSMLSLFLGSDGLMMEAIHNEGKGRCMYQHVCHGGSVSTEKAKTKVECRSKYEISPSSANLHELIPPSVAVARARSIRTISQNRRNLLEKIQ